MKRSLFSICVSSVLICGLKVSAMDRLSALSMLESGNNDHARGSRGEVSRYQVLPALWKRYGHGDPANPRIATRVVYNIMHDRASQFYGRYHHLPSDFEFYVLWNAPAEINHPSAAVRDRAERFSNLCTKQG